MFTWDIVIIYPIIWLLFVLLLTNIIIFSIALALLISKTRKFNNLNLDFDNMRVTM